MEIVTKPACRVGWQGQTLRYVVRADGASEIVVPEHAEDGFEVRVAGTRQVGDGVEADVEVRVLDSTLY